MIDRGEIIKLAREAGLIFNEDHGTEKAVEIHRSRVERFAAMVEARAAAAEREACIDIVALHGGSIEIEAGIRARGQS